MQIIFYLTATFLTTLALVNFEVECANLEPTLKDLKIGDTQYVDSGKSHYGFTREDNGIFKTVSVNDDKITVWLPDCTTIIRTWPQLNRVDRKAVKEAQRVINNAYKNFDSLEGVKEKRNYMEIYKTTNEPNSKQTSKTLNKKGFPLFQHAPSDIVEYNDREISFRGDKLEKMDPELRRVFVNKKSIAYVYKDRFVIMKPRWCQFKDDQALLQDLGMKF